MRITAELREIIKWALREDIGTGDITTELTVSPDVSGSGAIYAREEGTVAGLDICREVFRMVDGGILFAPAVKDGDEVEKGRVVVDVSGSLCSILTAERTALNFLQRLSGIATMTRNWVKQIKDYPAQLLDTRKTTPGLRAMEKYAVAVGGGRNHRKGLFDGILIKENHIKAAGGIKEAVELAKNRAPVTVKIEVEVENLEELAQALEAGADLIMLDNIDMETMRRAVALTGGLALLEASGDMTISKLREVAATGVDFISSGALTHSSRWLNFSFLIEEVRSKNP